MLIKEQDLDQYVIGLVRDLCRSGNVALAEKIGAKYHEIGSTRLDALTDLLGPDKIREREALRLELIRLELFPFNYDLIKNNYN